MKNGLTQKQIGFVNDVFNECSLHQAYVNHYNTKNMLPDSIDRMAFELRHSLKIASSLAELNDAAKSKLVATEIERKEILSEIARGKLSQFVDEHGVIDRRKLDSSAIQGIDEQTVMGRMATVIKLRLHNPINAISELNKMDGAYTESPTIQDNRVVNIFVIDQKTKDLMERVHERTGKLIAEGG